MHDIELVVSMMWLILRWCSVAPNKYWDRPRNGRNERTERTEKKNKIQNTKYKNQKKLKQNQTLHFWLISHESINYRNAGEKKTKPIRRGRKHRLGRQPNQAEKETKRNVEPKWKKSSQKKDSHTLFTYSHTKMPGTVLRSVWRRGSRKKSKSISYANVCLVCVK